MLANLDLSNMLGGLDLVTMIGGLGGQGLGNLLNILSPIMGMKPGALGGLYLSLTQDTCTVKDMFMLWARGACPSKINDPHNEDMLELGLRVSQVYMDQGDMNSFSKMVKMMMPLVVESVWMI